MAGSPDSLGWAFTQLRLGIVHLGVIPPDTSPVDLDEIVFEIVPRKVTVQASAATEIVQKLTAFWSFLQREFGLENAAACLEVLERDAVARLEAELADSDNFGPAKRFAMFSKDLGYDLATEEGTAQAMLAYNTAIAGSSDRGSPALAGPTSQGIDPGWRASPAAPARNPRRASSRRKKRRKAAREPKEESETQVRRLDCKRLLEALDDELQDLRLAKERLKEPARRWTQEELEKGLDQSVEADSL